MNSDDSAPLSAATSTTMVDRVLPVIGLMVPLVAFFASKGMALILVVIALAALIDLVRAKPRSWPFGRLVPVLVGLLLAWSAMSAVWEFTPGLALTKTGQLLVIVLGGAIAFIGLGRTSAQAARRTMWALAAGLVIGLSLTAADGASSCRLSSWSDALRGKPPADACMMFRYKVGVAVSMLLCAPLFAMLWRHNRLGIVGLGMLLIAGAAATSSHTAALNGVIGIGAFFGFLYWRRTTTTILVALVLGLITFAPVVASHLPTSRQAVESWHHFPSSLSHRLVIWAFTNQRIHERPLLGWGADAARAIPGGDDTADVFDVSTGTIRAIPGPQLPLHPHNNGLQIWLEYGAVGAVLYSLLVLALAFRLSLIDTITSRSTALTVLSMALVTGLASFGVWQSWWLSTLWIVAGLTRVFTASGNQARR